MFDGVSATTVKVTVAATVAAAVADVLGNEFQIDIVGRPTGICRCFFVGAGGVVTYQTIHMTGIGEIKSGVAPAISCVTTCATRLVADDAHSVVVKSRRPFAVFYLSALILGVGGGATPLPVCRMQHIVGFILMAAQALGGHL